MKFRNKILLAIWSVVLVLVVITYIILNYWMRVQVQFRFTEDLRSNYRTLHEIHSLRGVQDIKSCQIIAESPRLRAVVELEDRNTALQLSQELARSVSCDLFILTNGTGQSLAEIVDGIQVDISTSTIQSIAHALRNESFADVMNIDSAVYRSVSTPINVGSDLVGTLTIGYRIRPEDLATMKAMLNSEVIVTIDSMSVATTLTDERPSELSALVRDVSRQYADVSSSAEATVFTLDAPRETYVGTSCRIDKGNILINPMISYLLLKPIEQEVRSVLKPVVDTFISVSILVLIFTAGVGYFVSKGISSPIAALVRGTMEVSRGNYDHRIDVHGGGELKFLAQKFEEMSASLKEKINLLADRNKELEEAMKQLKEKENELLISERLAATGKLTAQLSHEINNPIHNIQSCLQTVLKRTPTTSPERELLDLAYEETERLARLTRQMLDVYRTSIVQEQGEPVLVNEVIKEVLTSSQKILEESHVDVKMNLRQSLPRILGSGDKLKQVFLNLVINAKDAMPEGGVLSIETTQQNGNVTVTVADTGIGIPQENMNRIFDAFFTTKSKVSGVGLGLAVTYGIIRQHNGTISVKSNVGEGTVFTLQFPVQK